MQLAFFFFISPANHRRTIGSSAKPSMKPGWPRIKAWTRCSSSSTTSTAIALMSIPRRSPRPWRWRPAGSKSVSPCCRPRSTTPHGGALSLIDNLSKGRLIVGLGRGSLVNTHEYSGYQIDPESAQERFEEIEKILLQCWTQEKVVHSGKYWNFEIPMLRPRPCTRPHPQILRSVASESSLAAQAKLGRPVLMAAATAQGAAGISRFIARPRRKPASAPTRSIMRSSNPGWPAPSCWHRPIRKRSRSVCRITSKCKPIARRKAPRSKKSSPKAGRPDAYRSSAALPRACWRTSPISPRPALAACSCAFEPVRCRRNFPRGR